MFLRYTEAKGDDAKYLGAAASRDKAADAATEFAVVKNAAGAYSLVAVSAVTDGGLAMMAQLVVVQKWLA